MEFEGSDIECADNNMVDNEIVVMTKREYDKGFKYLVNYQKSSNSLLIMMFYSIMIERIYKKRLN